MTRAAKIRRVIKILERHLGEPRQSGTPPPPLDMLMATVLSQNTNDKNSHRAYTQLRGCYPRWDDVKSAPLSRLRSLLRVGGMADQKARRIKHILAEAEERFGDADLRLIRNWSTNRILEELTAIKGIGPKTAACVCLFSLRRDVFPVDTHVHRICGRLGIAPGARTPEETFRLMQGAVPRGKSYSLHTNLIRFGRRVCHAHAPRCGVCPMYSLCTFEGKGAIANERTAHSRTDHDFMLLDNVS